MTTRLRTASLALACLVGCATSPPPPRAHADPVPAVGQGSLEPLQPPPPLPPRPAVESLPSPRPRRRDVLTPGLGLSVTVTGEEALSVERTQIGADGVLFLPFLGEVPAAGRTPQALERTLAELLVERGLLKQAQVRVTVPEASGRKVYVLGRVRSPGAFDLPFDRDLTLTQVIALAGGLGTSRADLEADASAIRLLRDEPEGRRVYRLSFLDVVGEGDLAADLVVQDGDVIYVPPKQELFIFGSVNKPGGFQLAHGSRLAVDEALGLAGGLSDNADRERILLVRRTPQGGRTYLIPTDPALRAQVEVTTNDTLIVSPRAVSRVYVLGSVERQGGIPLEPDLTVTKALALAGGLTRVAAANSVKLIRVSGGEKRIYSVPVADIIAGGDAGQDPVLEPGDLIWVPEGLF